MKRNVKELRIQAFTEYQKKRGELCHLETEILKLDVELLKSENSDLKHDNCNLKHENCNLKHENQFLNDKNYQLKCENHKLKRTKFRQLKHRHLHQKCLKRKNKYNRFRKQLASYNTY